MYHEKTALAAKGKWKGIFRSLGVDERFLTGRHCPCPVCGGEDRFRFDNLDGRGTSICSACGGRDGMQLAMEITGFGFADTAARIDALLGNEKYEPDKPRERMSDDDRRRILVEVYGQTQPMAEGDLADKYLASRNISRRVYPEALRFGQSLRDGEGGVRPAMVAMVGVHGDRLGNGRQRYVSMHRTFLRADGMGKAEMGAPKKLMPGELPDGACVMLSEWNGGTLGVAEGIETALAASRMYSVPVWAVISTSMMQRFIPPEGCDELVVFGDHDPKHGGHAAAYALSHKVRAKGVETRVLFPDREGEDFADVWALQCRRSAS